MDEEYVEHEKTEKELASDVLKWWEAQPKTIEPFCYGVEPTFVKRAREILNG